MSASVEATNARTKTYLVKDWYKVHSLDFQAVPTLHCVTHGRRAPANAVPARSASLHLAELKVGVNQRNHAKSIVLLGFV